MSDFSHFIFALQGCIDDAAFLVFHLECAGTILWNSCCTWHCSVSRCFSLIDNWHFFSLVIHCFSSHLNDLQNLTLLSLYSCSYVLSFSLGAGPVPALLLPEIFASRIRAKAVALSLGMHWVSKVSCYFLFFIFPYKKMHFEGFSIPVIIIFTISDFSIVPDLQLCDWALLLERRKQVRDQLSLPGICNRLSSCCFVHSC